MRAQCLSAWCGQKIYKSKGDRQCKIGQKNVCLFCSYAFSVYTGQADRGINAPLQTHHCSNSQLYELTHTH